MNKDFFRDRINEIRELIEYTKKNDNIGLVEMTQDIEDLKEKYFKKFNEQYKG